MGAPEKGTGRFDGLIIGARSAEYGHSLGGHNRWHLALCAEDICISDANSYGECYTPTYAHPDAAAQRYSYTDRTTYFHDGANAHDDIHAAPNADPYLKAVTDPHADVGSHSYKNGDTPATSNSGSFFSYRNTGAEMTRHQLSGRYNDGPTG